jgi:catechol 2,3-dioxygenase-like lactoylglutathione lyase family enzyme
VTRGAALTNVFGFTADRERVARFFEDVLGLRRQQKRDDSIWFEPEGGATFTVHDREDEPETPGFVPWFQVDDLAAAFERVRAQDANVGELRDGYFFARDPDGRLFGIRRWR